MTRSILLAILAVAGAAGQPREVAYLKASNAKANDHFGNGGTLEGKGVALSGDGRTLAVSAPYESSGAKGVNGNQNDMSNTGEAGKGDQPSKGDQFGFSVAVSADGNTLAVGAISEDSGAKGVNGDQNDNSQPSSGAVYLFTRGGSAWTRGR